MPRSSNLRIAWRNLGRSRRRTALAVLAVAIGQIALLGLTSLMHGYADNIRLAVTGPMLGHAQIHAPLWREERAMELTIPRVDELVSMLKADPQVTSAAARLYAPALIAPKRDAFTAMVMGVDVSAESKGHGMLAGLDEPLQPQHVILGHRLATRIQVTIGQEVALVGQSPSGAIANDLYTVQDIVSCPVDMVNQSGVVMSLADARAFLYLDEDAHEIVVRADSSVDGQALATRLRQFPELAELETKSWMELAPELETMIRTSDYMGYIIVILVFVAAVAGIANTLLMSTFERQHELGMLLALGATPGRLVQLIILEALCIGLVGIVIGTGTGVLLVELLQHYGLNFAAGGGEGADDLAFKGLNLPLHVYPRLAAFDVVMGVTAITLTSLVASIWPAWVTSRLDPMEAMRR